MSANFIVLNVSLYLFQPAFNLELSVGGSSDLHLSFSDATSTLTANSHDGSAIPQITPFNEK